MVLLPINEMIPELLEQLQKNNYVILTAEPGAGKTTRVPPALLDCCWNKGKKMIMLEPRRLAAKTAAAFIASQLGEKIGETVGYRVRGESKISNNTKIEIVTEGVFVRMVQQDPSLEQVGTVIFDEFHERNLYSDLSLALLMQTIDLFRDDMKVIIMSATLQLDILQSYLKSAPIIASRGRQYPVQIMFAEKKGDFEQVMEAFIVKELKEQTGDILAFLPGMAEINQMKASMEQIIMKHGMQNTVNIYVLHGSLPLIDQEKATRRLPDGLRKIVLATTIAESSLTVEGITSVVDSGLTRKQFFSPRTGMQRLETVPISIASAVQRSGRAGRLAPGRAYRCWTEEEHRMLEEQAAPEITTADLAAAVLELKIWGVDQLEEMDWLTAPSLSSFQQAAALLQSLELLDKNSRVTDKGRTAAQLGAHPRLAAMMIGAASYDVCSNACLLAALLSEREQKAFSQSNLEERIGAIKSSNESFAIRVKEQAQSWFKQLTQLGHKYNPDTDLSSQSLSYGALLALSYPDRIAKRRGDGTYVLASGRGARLGSHAISLAVNHPYLTVCEIEDSGSNALIRSAAPVAEEELMFVCKDKLILETQTKLNAAATAIRTIEVLRIGAVVINEHVLQHTDAEQALAVWRDIVKSKGMQGLNVTKSARQQQARMMTMRQYAGEDWPDVSDDALVATTDEWLIPQLYAKYSIADLEKVSLMDSLKGMLTWEQQQELDQELPIYYRLPSGSKTAVDYSDPDRPIIAAKLQELFGLQASPLLAKGKLRVTIQLLSPAQRPVQVTSDLASFWSHTYFEVKKDLKGRYPKHYWPDNPLEAIATNRVRPRT